MSAHHFKQGVSQNVMPGAADPVRLMPTLLGLSPSRVGRELAALTETSSEDVSVKVRHRVQWPKNVEKLSENAFTSLLFSTVKEFNREDAATAQAEEAQQARERAERQAVLEERLKSCDTVIKCREAAPEVVACFALDSNGVIEEVDQFNTVEEEDDDAVCICSSCSRRQERAPPCSSPRRRRSHSVCAQEEHESRPPDGNTAAALLDFQTVPIHLPDAQALAANLERREHESSVCSGGGDVVDLRRYGVADTGANKHCVSRHVRLSNKRFQELWMRDAAGKSTLLQEAGDFELPCLDNNGNELEPMLVQNASVVPNSPFNLLSVSLLCERGVSFKFSKTDSHMLYKGMKYELIKHNGLYLIDLSKVLEPMEVEAMGLMFGQDAPSGSVYKDKSGAAFFSAGDYSLWHERFGHTSKARIRFLFDNKAVEGMKIKGNPNVCARGCSCEVCRMSEKRRRSIPGQRQFADPVSRPGELVYSDVCGPFPPSVQGYRYVISFTDQLTRFSVCYLLKSKSDSSGALRAAHAFFAEHNIILSKVRSDQGGEYSGSTEREEAAGESGRIRRGGPKRQVSKGRSVSAGQSMGVAGEESILAYGEQFQAVCKELKINHELMPAHVPQLHGLAERWNGVVVKMANSMLYNARLSYVLWPEAIAHANYLRNRLPVRGLGPITPYELFVGKRPRVDDLRVFGSDAYKLLPVYPKTPGNNARKRLLYVGQSANRVGFRCFDPVTYKFSTEFELIFDEASGKKRMNQLRQHDVRRELLRRGKLGELPLVQDDYVMSTPLEKLNVQQQDIQRRLFESIQGRASEAAELGGGSGHRLGQSSRGATIGRPYDGQSGDSDGYVTERRNCSARAEDLKEESEKPGNSNSASSSASTLRHGPGVPTRQASEGPGAKRRAQEAGRKSRREEIETTDSPSAPVWDGSKEASESPAGSPPVSPIQPIIPSSGAVPANVSPESESECRVRTGPQPLLPRECDANDSPINISLNEQDAGDIHSHDAEAEKFGPLTEVQMQRERALSSFDPTRPLRPVRVVPIGVPEDDSDAFKQFRQASMQLDYPIEFVPNPKKPGSLSFKRYTRYSQASTLREIVELSVRGKSAKQRREEKSKALADIVFDSLRGYIIWPQHEHPSVAHYVDASEIAKAAHTVNVMALWSEEELREIQEEAKVKHSNVVLAAIEEFESRRRVARGAEILETMSACRTYGTALMANAFQDQVASLWSREDGSYQRDGQRNADLVAAAVMVEELMVDDIPTPATYNKAIAPDNPQREEWLASMKRERTTLAERGTWEMVPITVLKGRKPIGSRYVYKVKRNLDRSIQFKSRLVAQGFSQKEGIDYSLDQIYAGVVSYSSMRFLLSMACQNNYVISQTDITGAYLESYLEEEIFMKAPPDMFRNGRPPKNADGVEMVCKLKRGLYGLKQCGYLWSQVFKSFLLSTADGVPTSRVSMDEVSGDVKLDERELEDVGDGSIDLTKCKSDRDYSMGFQELTGDNSLYQKRFILNGRVEHIVLGTYVDDCIVTASSESARAWFMKRLEHRFPVNPKSTGVIGVEKPGHVLSMEVKYDRQKGVLSINQREAIEALARKHGLNGRSVRKLPIASDRQLPKLSVAEVAQKDYLSLVGSCLHLAQVSRPDIGYAIGVLSRHSQHPGKEHYEAAQDLIRYLYGSRELNIVYKRSAKGNEPDVFERGAPLPPKESIQRRLAASVPEDAPNEVEQYVDADYGGCKQSYKSTSGMITFMNGGPISWSSRLQKMVAQSSAESEVLAVVDSMKEALHLKLLAEECGIREPGKPVRVWEDNMAAILLGEKMKNSRQTKHFAIRLRFMYEHIVDGTIQFWKVDTKDQLADGLTKALSRIPFEEWRNRLLAGSV